MHNEPNVIQENASHACTYIRTRCLHQVQFVIAIIIGMLHQPVNMISRRFMRLEFANAIIDAKLFQHLNNVVVDVQLKFGKTSNFIGIESTVGLVDGLQAFLPGDIQLSEEIVVLLWSL